MFNIFKTSFKIDIAYATNSLIYSFKSLPFLGQFFSDSLYKSRDLKKVIGILGILLTTCKLLLGRLFYFLVVYGVACILGNNSLIIDFIYVYVIFALIGAVINTNLLNTSTKKYFSIILFNMDAKGYLLCDFIVGLILSFGLNLVGFAFISLFINVPLLSALLLSLFSLLCRVVGEGISISFYKKHKYLLITKYVLTYTYAGILLATIFFSKMFIPYGTLIFKYGFVISIILAILSFIYIFSVDDYRAIYKMINTQKNVMTSNNTDSRQAMLEVKDKNKIINSKKLQNKKGYDFFNTIFFERHKEILLSSAKRTAFISALVIVGVVVLIIKIPEVFNFIKKITNFNASWLVIIMYCINRGAVVTQAMFYNCDHAMLTYNFYREPKVLMKLFEKRLVTVVKVNLIPAIVIALGTILFLYFTSNTVIINYITLPLFVICLSIFFSVHYLVIYYLLQPFNKDLKIKKASYNIVYSLTAYIAFMLGEVSMSSLNFSIFGLLFTILYIALALYLVYRFAPLTFKLND